MKITKENILIYDIETIKGCFLCCFYKPSDDVFIDFIVHKDENQLPALLKFLDENKDFYQVGYNNLNFDSQVIEYIWRHQEMFLEQTNETVCELIWQKSQDIIETSNHGGFAPYKEFALSFKQLDVFKIQHFDNKNRRVGLKRLEFEMDAEDVREMNIPHTKLEFNEEELNDLIYYCHNDVINTYTNYLYLIGETDNEIYKGTNAIELREDLTNLFGINCLNYSNSKYGDEIMKKIYAKEMNMEVKDLPSKGTFRSHLSLGHAIPKFISFKTPVLKDFLKEIKNKVIGVNDSFERVLSIGSRKHTFALGGLHSHTENEYFEIDEETELIDEDVTGYYPWTIISQMIAPKHLNKKAFVKVVKWLFDERSKLKPLISTNPEYKSLVSGYKEANVSIFT